MVTKQEKLWVYRDVMYARGILDAQPHNKAAVAQALRDAAAMLSDELNHALNPARKKKVKK